MPILQDCGTDLHGSPSPHLTPSKLPVHSEKENQVCTDSNNKPTIAVLAVLRQGYFF